MKIVKQVKEQEYNSLYFDDIEIKMIKKILARKAGYSPEMNWSDISDVKIKIYGHFNNHPYWMGFDISYEQDVPEWRNL